MRTQIDARAFLHRLRNALIAAVLCAVLAIGGAYWLAARKIAKVPTVKIDASVLEPGGNYLLVGSDSRSFVTSPQDAQAFGSAQAQTGQRSDTIMVAHIDGSDHAFGPAIALHARALTFLHPTTREPVTLKADIPAVWCGRFAHLLANGPA